MNRISTPTVLAIAMSATTSCPAKQQLDEKRQEYRYYFHESTGPNKFVLIEGVERELEFDGKSDMSAVKALLSLKWNVLYPNSRGTILLLGTYHANACRFSLQHWVLPAPFKAYPGETTLEPGELEWRDELRRSDFEPTLENDPRIYSRPPGRPR